MPKVIVNSGYIKDISHFLNYITYAGEKLEAQEIVFNDGTTQEVNPDTFIDFTNDKLNNNVSGIRITFKDGRSRDISLEQYGRFAGIKQEHIEQSVLIGSDKQEIQQLDPVEYIKYIAHRPSVEKIDDMGHGLFDMNGVVDIGKSIETAQECETHVKWSHIVSLTREDAERTGFNNRKAWENIIRAKAYDIAKLYNISPKNLVLHCAYHDKDHHPHIHLFFYSKDKREGFIKGGTKALAENSQKMRSLFFNTIFKGEVSHLIEKKQAQENHLEKSLKELTQQLGSKKYIPEKEICSQLAILSEKLEGYTGRHYYGYLPKELKEQVNTILKTAVEKDTIFNTLYQQYITIQKEFICMYNDEPEKIQSRMDDFQNRFFVPGKKDNKTLHNIIVKSALQYNAALENNSKRKPSTPKEKAVDEISAGVVRKEKPDVAQNKRVDIPKVSTVADTSPQVVRKEKMSKANSRLLSYAACSMLNQLGRAIAKDTVNDFSFSNLKKPKKLKHSPRFKVRKINRNKHRHIANDQTMEY